MAINLFNYLKNNYIIDLALHRGGIQRRRTKPIRIDWQKHKKAEITRVPERGSKEEIEEIWDIHYLLDFFSLNDMIALHKERSEWTHNESEILSGLLDFSLADEMPDPICLLNKDWGFIKMDFIDTLHHPRYFYYLFFGIVCSTPQPELCYVDFSTTLWKQVSNIGPGRTVACASR